MTQAYYDAQNAAFLMRVGVKGDAYQRCLEVMRKYGARRWWTYDTPPQETAYRQVHEQVLLIYSSRFHDVLEILLGRKLAEADLSFAQGISEDLIDECDRCYRAWKGEQ